MEENLHIKLLNFRQTQWENWIEERKPFSVLFELTPKCNMDCIHCYLQNTHLEDELSYDKVISILDILYDNGILFLTMTGGEILLRSDFLDIYLYAKKRGFLIELFSNGLLFTDDIIETLQKYPPLYVDVSLYGASEEAYKKVTRVQGAFNKVITNCKKIKNAGINLSLRSPIIKETENQMEDMKNLAEELNVPFVCTFEICPTVDGCKGPQEHQVEISTILKYEFDDYYRQIENGIRSNEKVSEKILQSMKNEYVFSCNVGLNSFVIDFKGNMCPCMKLKHHGMNILKNEYEMIWNRFDMYSKMKSTESYKCRKCDARYYCDICPAEMDFIFGDYEYRLLKMCNLAKFRKDFYDKEKSYENILIEAEGENENTQV